MSGARMLGLLERGWLAIETWVAAALLGAAVLIGPYYLVHLPDAGRAGTLALLAAGCLLAAVLIGPAGERLLKRLRAATAGIGAGTGFAVVLAAGVVAQLAVALLTQPIPNSDGGNYLQLAKYLALGQPYQDPEGHRAFWPPGFPLVLAPFVALFGANLVAVALCNLCLYLVGVFSARGLGAALFGARPGVIAALLFTFWPSRLLTAAVASKENLTIAAVLAGTMLCVRGLQGARLRWGHAAGAGIAFGIAGLAQPGLLLFVLSMPLCYRYLRGASLWRYFGFSAIVLACAALALVPWQMRNCALFDGQFCGVATNGGSVFYRANNPLATGEWTAEGAIPITHLPELEQNRLGFELGKQWILANPGDFAILAAKKLGLLLRDDRYGAYWGVLRGTGHEHTKAIRLASSERMLAYQVLNTLSWLFWAGVTGLIANRLIRLARRGDRAMIGRLLPLLYPLLYSAAVFAVFESDRRQHMMALALLLVLAAWAIDKGTGEHATDATR